MVSDRPLYVRFKALMPRNDLIVKRACNDLLAGESAESIKSRLSELVEQLHERVYKDYLEAETRIGDQVLEEFSNELSFKKLDRFFLSVSQSRKTRAGKAFEIILEELLANKLGYPMEGQIKIRGAKPDFVMPDKKYFDQNPIDCMLLTAKRTLRERWRQVVTEANVTYSYFLATLDPDITKGQLLQTAKHKIYLVTTKKKIAADEDYQSAGNVLSFEEFLSLHLDPAVERWEKNR